MNSGPQRTAIGKPDDIMIPTISLRLGDQLFWSPNAVVDQSLLAIRPAISFFVEGGAGGCFAPLSSNNIDNCLWNWRESSKPTLVYNRIGTKVEELTYPSATRQSA